MEHQIKRGSSSTKRLQISEKEKTLMTNMIKPSNLAINPYGEKAIAAAPPKKEIQLQHSEDFSRIKPPHSGTSSNNDNIADWAATFALSKLSDAQADRDHRNPLWVIWAPLLLLHLGAPDTITAYSSEDNQLWMRHLFGLLVQTSVAIYVVVMSWKHSWFSTMSIPALVAGLIKYGERVRVLMSVSRDKSRKILPISYQRGGPGGSNLENNDTLEHENSMRVLCIAHEYLEEFIETSMQFYDLRYKKHFLVRDHLDVHDIDLFWDAIETEMGLMFDLLHTKAAIKFRREGLVLRCISFACTMTVLIGLICRFFSMRVDQEKWKEVDAVITVVLLVGALALEIYAVIASYLFSDWAMLWLLQQNKGKQRILQLRRKIPWLFRPKRYKCRKVGQFDLLDFILKGFRWRGGNRGRILRSLLRIDRLKGLFDECVHKPDDIDRSLLHYPILYSSRRLSNLVENFRTSDDNDAMCSADNILGLIISFPFSGQIVHLHIATEILCCDTCDDASSSSSLWDKNRNMCRILSRYMMYLLITRSSLLPVAIWGDTHLEKLIKGIQPDIGSVRNATEACIKLEERERDRPGTGEIVAHFKKIDKKELRWEALKLVWVRMLCYAASKGQTNEHLGQLSQGGEFLTFLWFFLPQSRMLESRPEGSEETLTKPSPESRVYEPREHDLFTNQIDNEGDFGKDMLEEDFVKKNPGWVEELTLMVKTKQKAEIQALSSFGFQYLSEVYLSLKLQQKDWL
ncbi:hypothetical protein Vadar_025766 [Vaccinium darrowii]|uniref:Uncharacterized protein n=1 Tax=Vaccinium darrowii TaxID=229202 RepID=A0ACB7ZLK4_9ERIC|nr:hypothetical protein Vadar_025766 [Vaccinium darrowii]